MKKTALALFINIIALSLSGCSDDNELFVMDNSSKNNESCDQNSLTRSSLTLESDWEKMEYVTRPNGKNEMLPWYIRANSPVDHTVLSDMKKKMAGYCCPIPCMSPTSLKLQLIILHYIIKRQEISRYISTLIKV